MARPVIEQSRTCADALHAQRVQADFPAPGSEADANHNGIPDGYEFAHAAEFVTEREWRHRGVPMAALLGISTHGFHPSNHAQVPQHIQSDLDIRQRSDVIFAQVHAPQWF